MIRVRGLIKHFSGFPALSGLDMNVKAGEIYGFIGQNGAGKTTAMNILAGLSQTGAIALSTEWISRILRVLGISRLAISRKTPNSTHG